MRKEKQILFRKLALVSAIATALAGCGADDQAYDTLAKPDNLVSKTQIKTDQVYLYMPSMAKAPDYAVSMAPFTQGKEKLVTLKFEGDVDSNESGSLQVRMISQISSVRMKSIKTNSAAGLTYNRISARL